MEHDFLPVYGPLVPYRGDNSPLHATLERFAECYELYRNGFLTWREYIAVVGLTPEDFPEPGPPHINAPEAHPKTIWERLNDEESV